MEHLARKQLRLACQDGNLQRVQELHRQGVSLPAASNDGRQPIHSASLNGHLDIVQWLHGQGASLTAADNDGWQPIHLAADRGHLDIVQWLVGQGASLTAGARAGTRRCFRRLPHTSRGVSPTGYPRPVLPHVCGPTW